MSLEIFFEDNEIVVKTLRQGKQPDIGLSMKDPQIPSSRLFFVCVELEYWRLPGGAITP